MDGMLVSENQRPTEFTTFTKHGTISDALKHSFPQRYADSYAIALDTFLDVLEGQRILYALLRVHYRCYYCNTFICKLCTRTPGGVPWHKWPPSGDLKVRLLYVHPNAYIACYGQMHWFLRHWIQARLQTRSVVITQWWSHVWPAPVRSRTAPGSKSAYKTNSLK